MKRINLDNVSAEVRTFLESLTGGDDTVELELDGRVVAMLYPESKAALLSRVRESIARSQRRNADKPRDVIEREIDEAVEAVRREQRST